MEEINKIADQLKQESENVQEFGRKYGRNWRSSVTAIHLSKGDVAQD